MAGVHCNTVIINKLLSIFHFLSSFIGSFVFRLLLLEHAMLEAELAVLQEVLVKVFELAPETPCFFIRLAVTSASTMIRPASVSSLVDLLVEILVDLQLCLVWHQVWQDIVWSDLLIDHHWSVDFSQVRASWQTAEVNGASRQGDNLDIFDLFVMDLFLQSVFSSCRRVSEPKSREATRGDCSLEILGGLIVSVGINVDCLVILSTEPSLLNPMSSEELNEIVGGGIVLNILEHHLKLWSSLRITIHFNFKNLGPSLIREREFVSLFKRLFSVSLDI